ncbi:MAG: hypothetical protein HQM01_15900 [Magnetococcales bacterium]|nr:hypothetical protein [Magnetococcales bacterium]
MLALQTPQQQTHQVCDCQAEPMEHLSETARLVLNQERLLAELRRDVQLGIDSGPSIPADQLFAELTARYADHPA